MKKAHTTKPVTLEAIGQLIEQKFGLGFAQFELKLDQKLYVLEQRLDDKIDALAMSVQHGFEAVDKRFNRVENRLEALELRQDNVAYRFEINELSQRVTVLEQKIKF